MEKLTGFPHPDCEVPLGHPASLYPSGCAESALAVMDLQRGEMSGLRWLGGVTLGIVFKARGLEQ